METNWENVKAVLHANNKKNVKKYIKTLKENGYYNYLIRTNPKDSSKQFDYNVALAQETNDISQIKNGIIYEQSINFSKGYKKIYQHYAPTLICRTSDLIKLKFDNGELKNASYLTGKEKLRLQGFPDIECLSDNQKHIVAGNSINIPNLIYVFTVFGMKIQEQNKMSELKEVIKGDYYEI